MTILDRLERRFRRYAVPNVTVGLIACQVLAYLLHFTRPDLFEAMELVPARVLEGQVWRLVTFVFFVFRPSAMHPIFAFFFWYLFYLMGTTLEHTWGTFRYNFFLLIGYVATVAVSFITPDQPASVAFLQGSVFLPTCIPTSSSCSSSSCRYGSSGWRWCSGSGTSGCWRSARGCCG